MSGLSDCVHWWAKRSTGMALDFLYGVDTGPEIVNKRGSHAYDPAPWRTLNQPMRLAALRAEGSIFMDIGCGKGRVLLSALAFPFTRIAGVELSPTLAKIAEKNLRSARLLVRRACSSEVICGDAAEFAMPDEPGIVFFYNPFPLETMQVVLGRIVQSHVETPRRISLVFFACSSNIAEIAAFLLSNTNGRARRLASANVGRRSINIFQLP